MGGEYGHLTLDERRRMFKLREARQPVGLIAATLGRHKSTIYRELRRNIFREEGGAWQGYFPVTADQFPRDRRQRLGKLTARADLLDNVIDRLQAGWSPQQIAGRLKQSGSNGPDRVCHESIYRFVYDGDGRERELYRHLPKGRRTRRRRFGRKPRQSAIPNAHWIAIDPNQLLCAKSSATGKEIC
jgi:IS30 family transposase